MIVTKDMTIYTAAELKPVLLGDVRACASPVIDLSNVSEIDSAGVQLLYLARREAHARGSKLCITGCGPAVLEILKLVGFPVGEDVLA